MSLVYELLKRSGILYEMTINENDGKGKNGKWKKKESIPLINSRCRRRQLSKFKARKSESSARGLELSSNKCNLPCNRFLITLEPVNRRSV
jgi:hypothetical protein